MEYILCHHGVKGMKWGVRRTPEQLAKASGKTSPSLKERASKTAKKAKNKIVKKVKNTVTKENTAKVIAKGAGAAAKVLEASVLDDVFYGGAGKKIAKETIKQTGRAAVTAYTMARGGYDIHWYDK